jgi:hypothetical protein
MTLGIMALSRMLIITTLAIMTLFKTILSAMKFGTFTLSRMTLSHLLQWYSA